MERRSEWGREVERGRRVAIDVAGMLPVARERRMFPSIEVLQ